MEPIWQAGIWWYQEPDGSWLWWNEAARRWEAPVTQSQPVAGYGSGFYAAQGPPQGQSGYGGGPGPGGAQTGGKPPGRVLTILGFVFGGIAVLFFPIIFGPAGIICAGIAMSKGDPLAKWALGVAIGGTVVGFALGYAYFESQT